MNALHRKLAELPAIRERVGEEQADKFFVELIILAEEIGYEMDGVRCPKTVSAILNRLSSITNELR